jgi:hypothetical protein
MGVMYASGDGVPQNFATAVEWYRLAASQGVADAQNNLGVMYVNGQGVRKDLVTAHMWFDLAAQRATGESRDKFSQARAAVASQLSPAQLARAATLATEWQEEFNRTQKR